MEIEGFDLVQLCLSGLVGLDGVTERVLVGVEKDALGVIISSATVGM